MIRIFYLQEKLVIPEELKKQLVDALHFAHPNSTKMPAEANIFRWAGMRKLKEEKCGTFSACMSSGQNLNNP